MVSLCRIRCVVFAGVLGTGKRQAQQAGTDFSKGVRTVLFEIAGYPFLHFEDLLAGCRALDLLEYATRLRASNATKIRIIMTLPETFFPTRESTDTLGLSLMITGRKDVNLHTKTPTFCHEISMFLSIYDPRYFRL